MSEPNPFELTAVDGYPLAATLYIPDEANQRTLLINAGMGIKQNYYAPYAAFLAQHGFTVLTYDYRGFGKSKPASLRGFSAHYLDLAIYDQTAALRWLAATYPGYLPYVVGHSLGGQLVGLSPECPTLRGILGIAAQSGYWRLWSGRGKLRMWFFFHVMIPFSTPPFGYFPFSKFSPAEDIPREVALEWAQAGRSPRYILDLYGGGEHDHFAKVTAPVCGYSFSDDNYAPAPTVAEWLTFYSQADTSHENITPSEIGTKAIGHFGFFRAQYASTLWAKSLAWLEG